MTLMSSFVAIDLETTGLDLSKDAIIEIGAVRFNGNRIEAEFQTLVNPGRPILPVITQITNISNEMVRNAPPLQAVLQNLIDFVGNDPVVGHNVRFDLGFLNRFGALRSNQANDTYELASVLLPVSPRYNLSALSQQLGLFGFNAHRALDDAKLTQHLFYALYQKAMELPLDLVAEIVRLGRNLDWDGNGLFQSVLRERSHQPIAAKQIRSLDYGVLFKAENTYGKPLSPNAELLPLDADETAAMLEYGGPFSQYFDQYEYRQQQVEMLRSICQAFTEGYHLMVEAGTGTGKSFAYLVPAALWSLKNNSRVVISTNTIALQDQLINKDIPDLNKALNLPLKSVVLKGRSNYLCPRRLEALRQRGPESGEELRVLAKVLVWLQQGGNGDRSGLNLNGPIERDLWDRISAEDEGCKAETCLSRVGGACPFYLTRQAAQQAHIIVVNHALLLSDVITGSRVLPDYDYLIIDEGHHLESASTGALSYRITQLDILRLLRELGGTNSGIIGRIAGLLRNILKPSDLAAFNHSVEHLTDLAFRFENDLTGLFNSLEEFMETMREGKPVSNYGQQQRITPSTRTLPAWSDVEIAWDSAGEILDNLVSVSQDIFNGLAELDEVSSAELEDAVGSFGTVFRRLSETANYLNMILSEPDADFVYWAEISSNNNRIIMQAAPLHIGPMMEKYLWHEKSSIVLTSATLTTHGEFDYLRGRLNADEADELILGSPFDYETATLLYLCNDIPEPSDAFNYQKAVERTLIRLSKSTGGKLLALFTSYAQLKKTSQAIGPALSEADIQVYEQGEGASANTLLETFRESDKAVLLGTRAFWEGVDIPGEALSVLVIIKLPFDVPSDPIISARSETFDDPFNEYQLPEAILRFRQGFGRLIRTQSDRGVVAILDRRIITKKYGRAFIESLPDCKIQQGSIQDLPQVSAKWLNL